VTANANGIFSMPSTGAIAITPAVSMKILGEDWNIVTDQPGVWADQPDTVAIWTTQTTTTATWASQ
jgi:hypothetical protein